MSHEHGGGEASIRREALEMQVATQTSPPNNDKGEE